MFDPLGKSRLTVLVLVLLFGVEAGARLPEVDLEYSPVTQTVLQGEVFEVGLIARSITGVDVSMAGINVILNWDPTKLELQGLNNNGPYDWLRSDFGPAGDFDNLNEDLDLDGIPDNDGDAFYQAFSQLGGDPAFATPSGLLATTFLFKALEADDPTPLSMPLTAGQFSETIVASGTHPGKNILNIRVEATVTILADCNGNGVVDSTDSANETSQDCNLNGIPDECEIDEKSNAPGGPFFCKQNCNPDCNDNGFLDECEVPPLCPTCTDCNANGVPDDCPGEPEDCNCNGIPDECDISCAPPGCNVVGCGNSDDNDGDGVPDECFCQFAYGDLNHDGIIDVFDLFCLLNGFSGNFTECSFEVLDIEPCGGNDKIDVFDLFALLNAFSEIDPCCSG